MTTRRPLVNNSGQIGELTSADAVIGNGSVPAGGTIGQSLSKTSNTDYDLSWISKVNGTITIAVVSSLPATPDSNTLYIVTG